MLTLQQAIARNAKPRIRLDRGVWFCGVAVGLTPKEAYMRWRSLKPKWVNAS